MFFIISQCCVSTPQSKFKMFYYTPIQENILPMSNYSPPPHLSLRKQPTTVSMRRWVYLYLDRFSPFHCKYRSLVFHPRDKMNRKDREQNGKHKLCTLNQPAGNTWQIYINLISQTSVFFIIKFQWLWCHLVLYGIKLYFLYIFKYIYLEK